MTRRLLILNTDLEIGGTPTVVRELARRLHAPPATHVEVAALSRWGPMADQIRHAGIEVTALGAKGATDLWVIRRLIDLIHQRHFDTVFSFLVHANAIAAAAKPSCEGVRFFQSIQTTQAHPAWHWHVQRFVHHAAEKVIVPSPSVARVATERAKVPPDKLIIIPNAIDLSDFAPLPRDTGVPPVPAHAADQSNVLLQSANPQHGRDGRVTGKGADTKPFPLGFLGRLDPIKMVPDLVAAVAELGDLVHLHIYGDGPDRPAVERAIRLHHLEKRVTLHGPVPRPQEALMHLGLLVLPSISEGMPMVLIEAMAAGVPVLGRDVPGVRDVITNGQTGALTPALTTASLATEIRRLIEDAPLRHRLATAARLEVEQRYTWPAVLGRYRDVLGLSPA